MKKLLITGVLVGLIGCQASTPSGTTKKAGPTLPPAPVTPAETPKEAAKEAPKDVPKEPAKEAPKEAPKTGEKEVPPKS